MADLSKDSRGFVDSVVSYIKSDGKSKNIKSKVKKMLFKVVKDSSVSGRGIVESVVNLSPDEKNILESIVVEQLGRTVQFEYKINEDLYGGLRITVGDFILDTSLKTQLEQIKSDIII